MSAEETLRILPKLLGAGDFASAEQQVLGALDSDPEHPGLNAFAAFISDRLGKTAAAIASARKAIASPGTFPRQAAQGANILARLRQFSDALAAARAINFSETSDPVVLDQLGACFTACESHAEARTVYERLVALIPHETRCRFNLAAAQRYTGDLEAAARNFDLASQTGPQASEAAYARSLLKKASAEQNHLDDLDRRLQAPGLDPLSLASLHYAKGKEWEDLEQWPKAFAAWTDGARAMRTARPYSVDPEIDAINETIKAWPAATARYAPADLTPVFIVSLPRAGSTLLDRILSNRDDVSSAGETEDFIVSLLADPALASRQSPSEIARKTRAIDIKAVGDRYRAALKQRGFDAGYVIDKTPTNFLYAGLIAEALPEARIIHVTRDPKDALIATYKTLFRDRYFWSYDLDDIAAYIAAYRRLMRHWLEVWPSRIEQIAYEHLVEHTEAEARRITAALDLDWNDACLDIGRNKAAVSTASAEHVRRPVYQSSIGHWKHFSDEIANVLPALAKLEQD